MTKTLLGNVTIDDAEQEAIKNKHKFERGEVNGYRYLDFTGQDMIVMEYEGRGVVLVEGAYQKRFEEEKGECL